MELLWLDDDSPVEPFVRGNIRIVTAHTCKKALDLLSTGKILPRWVIVDLLVPQGDWERDRFFRFPGLEFINLIHQTFRGQVKTIIFSVAATEERKLLLNDPAISSIFGKCEISFLEVLKHVEEAERSFESGAEIYQNDRYLYRNDIERLRTKLPTKEILNPSEVIAAHIGKLALETDPEKTRIWARTIRAASGITPVEEKPFLDASDGVVRRSISWLLAKLAPSHLDTLKSAIDAVPAVKYALGVAGVVSSVALIKAFDEDWRVTVMGAGIMVLLMSVLLVFSRLAETNSERLILPSMVLAWFSLLLTLGAAVLIFMSAFFSWPPLCQHH